MELNLIGTLIGLLILLGLFASMSAKNSLWPVRRSPHVLNTVTWNNFSLLGQGSKRMGALPRIFGVVILLALTIAPAGLPAVVSMVHAQPELVQIASQQPDQQVAVIVQKAVTGSAPEEMVTRLGGAVTQDLHIINAFSAEMPAQAALALAGESSVRWVSLDAKVTQSDVTSGFTTWATKLSTRVPNTFRNAAAVVDSELGPNDVYAVGSVSSGAFTGFAAEVTPDQIISKVEIAVRLYTFAAPISGQDPVLSVNANGIAGNTVTLSHTNFMNCHGLVNACTVYVDITNTRTWAWADFILPLDVVISQSTFSSSMTIFYDAVGLKVTTGTGTDTSYSNTPPSASSSSTISTSKSFSPLHSTSLSSSLSSSLGDDYSSLLNPYNAAVKATDVWSLDGLKGLGMTIAVVDSGMALTKDTGDRLFLSVNFNHSYHDSSDRFGHGTFVGSVVAGDGTASNGTVMGIAPQSRLLSVRVSNDQGASIESDVVASLQWILENKDIFGIRVVNLSLNSSVAQSYHTSPLDAAVEILWFNGIVVVVSSGNTGAGMIYPPANDPFVITVGAVDDMGTIGLSDDVMASFSTYGTTEDGFGKPDLVAPGKNIIALLPDNPRLTMGIQHPANRVNGNYFRMSGTSISAPIVSGAVALLLQYEPALTPDQVKYRLMATAAGVANWPGYDPLLAGAGCLDIYAAVHGTTNQSANTGLTVSSLLTTGPDAVNSSVSWNSVSWNSVSWNSVSWNSVSWNSVSWNSVSWNSVSWNSDYWGN